MTRSNISKSIKRILNLAYFQKKNCVSKISEIFGNSDLRYSHELIGVNALITNFSNSGYQDH